jgi:hypothetical protein
MPSLPSAICHISSVQRKTSPSSLQPPNASSLPSTPPDNSGPIVFRLSATLTSHQLPHCYLESRFDSLCPRYHPTKNDASRALNPLLPPSTELPAKELPPSSVLSHCCLPTEIVASFQVKHRFIMASRSMESRTGRSQQRKSTLN